MQRASRWIVAWMALLATLVAGCTQDDALPRDQTEADPQAIHVLDPPSDPIQGVQVATFRAGLQTALSSVPPGATWADLQLPEPWDEAHVWAPGHAVARLAHEATVVLSASNEPTPAGFFGFRSPVQLTCPTDLQGQVHDQVNECGKTGEPVLEIGGDGAIWVSVTGSIYRAPPIWISRDGGTSYDVLRDPIREAIGVEGDFAIAEDGTVYFADMTAPAVFAGGWFTSYAPDGTHSWSGPLAHRIMDRPWVRAGPGQEVYVVYNNVVSSVFLASHDGGRTWDPLLTHEFPCQIVTLGQGPTRDRLIAASPCVTDVVTETGPGPQIWISEDGGRTWSDPLRIPLPNDDPGRFDHDYFPMAPTVDEAGNTYVPFRNPTQGGNRSGIFLARLSPQGVWSGPFPVEADGDNFHVWAAASRPGAIGLAWYHSDDAGAGEPWVLRAAVSMDADAPVPHFAVVDADPLPVARDNSHPFGGQAFEPDVHQLGDFLQARFTPDGDLVVAYARVTPDLTTTHVVRQDGALPLAAATYANGPRA